MEVVYSITNKINNKIYIGSTVNYENRKKSHIRGLKGGYHDNKRLQEDFDIYGEDCFVFNVLCELQDGNESKRFKAEECYIRVYKSYEHELGYNQSYDGRGRYIISEETRNKMRKNNIGEKNPFYNKKHTEEAKKKMSESASIRTGSKNSFYGKSHNDKTKKKISEKIKEYYSNNTHVQKGVPKSEEHILKNKLGQPNRKEVYAEGKIYISVSECARDLKVVNSTVTNRIKSDKFPNYYFLSNEA